MNTGAISTRYAKALLLFVDQTGSGKEVYAQVRSILDNPDMVSQGLHPDLERFVGLVSANGRISYIKFIFTSFVRQYEESRNLHRAKLVTAVPSPEASSRVTKLVEGLTGGTVEMQAEVAPDIIGGFILELDGLRADASVSGQLEAISKEFQDRNKRIV